jgi:hypothetical protein
MAIHTHYTPPKCPRPQKKQSESDLDLDLMFCVQLYSSVLCVRSGVVLTLGVCLYKEGDVKKEEGEREKDITCLHLYSLFSFLSFQVQAKK